MASLFAVLQGHCCRLRPGVIDQVRVLAGRGYYSSRDLGTKGASTESEKAADSWLGFVGAGEQVLMVSHHCIVLYSIIDESYSSNKPFTVGGLTCRGAESVL